MFVAKKRGDSNCKYWEGIYCGVLGKSSCSCDCHVIASVIMKSSSIARNILRCYGRFSTPSERKKAAMMVTLQSHNVDKLTLLLTNRLTSCVFMTTRALFLRHESQLFHWLSNFKTTQTTHRWPSLPRKLTPSVQIPRTLNPLSPHFT